MMEIRKEIKTLQMEIDQAKKKQEIEFLKQEKKTLEKQKKDMEDEWNSLCE